MKEREKEREGRIFTDKILSFQVQHYREESHQHQHYNVFKSISCKYLHTAIHVQ